MDKLIKHFFRGILLCVTLLLSLTFVVSASQSLGATGKNLSTNYALVNLGDDTANVVAQYFKSPGGEPWDADAANESFTIDANYGQKGVAQYFDTTMTAGAGSVVISSDQPLGGVVQILARSPQVPTSGAYSSISSPSEKWFIPQVARKLATAQGTASSQVIVQNTESSPITTTIELIPFPGISGLLPYTKAISSIPAGTTYVYDLADESQSNVSDNWTGSAVVYGPPGKNIAVVANTFIGSNSLQTFNAFPQESVSSEWVIPMFTARLGNKLSTPVTFQNLSDDPIPANDVTMTCKSIDAINFPPATFTVTYTLEVVSKGSGGFNPVADVVNIPGPGGTANGWSGSCRLTSDSGKSMVVFVQMRRPGASDELAAYEAIPANLSDTKIVVPAMSKHQPNGFATAATIINLDTVNPAPVKLTYTPSATYVAGGGSSTPIVINTTIPAGGSIGQNLRFNEVTEIPNQWYGTLLIEPQISGDPHPIAAIVQLSNWLNPAGDTMMAHSTINLP